MQTEELATRYRKYRNALKIFALVLIISVGLGIFYWQVTAAKAEVVENWGMADTKEININSKVAGRVVKLYVDEGAHVEKGQLLAKIDSDTQEPQQRAAKANLAAKDEVRYRELLAAEAIPAQTYDAYRSKLEDAQAVLIAAQAEVAAARANLLKNNENKALEQAAREQAEALQGQLDAVEVMLGETEIFAPFAGVITKKFAEEGMLISTSVPLYSLQDINDNWVDFKVSETELKDFALGETDVIAFNVKVRTNNPGVWSGMRFRLER